MSVPPFLDLPDSVDATVFLGGFGPLAAISSAPAEDNHASLTPVVLVPGWTGSKEDFIAVLAPLQLRTGRTCVSYDQRGQYQSPGPDEPDGYQMNTLSDDLAGVIKQLGGSAHVVGHSFGGLVAQQLTVDHPDVVASLTLVCTGPRALPDERHPFLLLVADSIRDHGLAVTHAGMRAYEQQNGGAVELDPDVDAWLHHRFEANNPVALSAKTRLLTTAPDQVDAVAHTRVPVRVVHGATDDAWPLDWQAEMAIRLGTTVTVLPDCGHSPAAENPDALVDYLVSELAHSD